MALLHFVRGLDLSQVDLSAEHNNTFPDGVSAMKRLQWLRLRHAGIGPAPPDQLATAERLEKLCLSNNKLTNLHGELCTLQSLRILQAASNNISNGGLPDELMTSRELQVLDLSKNALREVPRGLERATSLLVLNLADNYIESVPSELFVHCTDLMHLDLSGNRLSTIPAQLRRLTNLQRLILDNNPVLGLAQLRSVGTLRQLQRLSLRNTSRTLNNFPDNLERLNFLTEVDISANDLLQLPDALYQVRSLERLNVSENRITDLNTISNSWPNMRVFNVSHNQLTELPSSIIRMSRLRKLYVAHNQLNFNGIPSGIGKLENLTVFSAAFNQLENIPEGLCRCGKLKRLLLNNNMLITLPDAIHYLAEHLDVFELTGNPNLIFPPKPKEMQAKGSGINCYNLDLSLDNLRRCGATPSSLSRRESTGARMKRLARRGRDASFGINGEGRKRPGGSESDSHLVLEGMRRIAKTKAGNSDAEIENMDEQLITGRSWKATLERPNLNYSSIFDDESLVGQMAGVEVWEIDEFLPRKLEDTALHGTFYEGDCYIVLHTSLHESTMSLSWQIYFWIGARASLDKKACAAMHAVNLRNMLGADSRTQREEQNDESVEFSSLFPPEIVVVEGEIGRSGFLLTDPDEHVVRLYRLSTVQPHTNANSNVSVAAEAAGGIVSRRLHLECVEACAEQLDSKFVFLLDAGSCIFVWVGATSRHLLRSKARLLAEKINKCERKNSASIIMVSQSLNNEDFWRTLGWPQPSAPPVIEDHVPIDWMPSRPVLYDVALGTGYLELPQISLPGGRLLPSLLNSKHVYVLDCWSDIFVWMGKKAPKMLRIAGERLAGDFCRLFKRRLRNNVVTTCLESAEPQIFKTRFDSWDEALAVDFTRSAESVARRGVNLDKILRDSPMRVDMRALFQPRQPTDELETALEEMEAWNEELFNEQIEVFLVEGKNFKKIASMDSIEFGHFYSQECYLLMAKYFVPEDELTEDEKLLEEEPLQSCIYFWQGRDASDLAWLTFSMGKRKVLEEAATTGADRPPQVIHVRQQQEDRCFMAHFCRRMILHSGKRQERGQRDIELYQMRCNSSALQTRTAQIEPKPSNLCSAFCHLLKIPFGDTSKEGGVVFLWIGRTASIDEYELMEEISLDMFPKEMYELRTCREGEEPLLFWQGLGVGAAVPYCREVDFVRESRLFKCSNEQGYFHVSEKCSDFCQDELNDDDVMLLDTGSKLYIWVGSRPSDVEKKLSLQAAKVYLQHLRNVQPDKPRKLAAAAKGKEPPDFRRCFHAWGKFRTIKEWSG